MNKKDLEKLLAGVLENNKKINGCKKPHDFSIPMKLNKKFNRGFICTKCGGYTWEINKVWYEKGLADSTKKEQVMCNSKSAVAAIEFALKTDDGIEFLRLWNEGSFSEIRDGWPGCPDECFVGAEVGFKSEII